jgi:predicted acylesterase/phospholipase RssA
VNTLKNILTGVFCSMDIPPLFPYMEINKDEFHEDGGVIDNLPIRFGTEVEECDLLFILPLNASFEKKVDQRSLIRRLTRVTEIRQGVLERGSFKLIYLYNELASLRQRVKDLEALLPGVEPPPVEGLPEARALSEQKVAERALERKHKVVDVFSICPAPELSISTTEFWKTKEAGAAFRFMYEVTRNELKQFRSLTNTHQLRMLLVSPVAAGSAGPNGVAINGNGTNGGAVHDPDFDSCKPFRKIAGDIPYEVVYFKDF